jgi:outer membrane autotransporter protein
MAGDTVIGSHNTSLRTAGMISGFDYRVAPGSVAGFALAAGTSNWGLSDSLGSGKSDVFQAGLYGSTRANSVYLSAAVAYALQRVSSDRNVTLSGNDRLSANFDTHGIGGRVELGNRFEHQGIGFTPYGALQFQTLNAPSYTESSTLGSNVFALAVDARKSNNTRSELGAWIDTRRAIDDGTLSVRARAAFVRTWRNAAAIDAAFVEMSGSNFTVTGAAPSSVAALVSLAAEVRMKDGWSAGLKFDGEFAQASQSYIGTGSLRYQW